MYRQSTTTQMSLRVNVIVKLVVQCKKTGVGLKGTSCPWTLAGSSHGNPTHVTARREPRLPATTGDASPRFVFTQPHPNNPPPPSTSSSVPLPTQVASLPFTWQIKLSMCCCSLITHQSRRNASVSPLPHGRVHWSRSYA